jgi:hypothetical protein
MARNTLPLTRRRLALAVPVNLEHVFLPPAALPQPAILWRQLI